MPVYSPTILTLVGGVPCRALSFDTAHGTDIPIPQATLSFALPRPAALVHGASVEVYLAMAGRTGRVFSGMIPEAEDAIDDSGKTVTVNAQGWSYLLAVAAHKDYAWGATTDGSYADSLIELVLSHAGYGRRGQPTFTIDRMTTLAGARILIGSNGAAFPDGIILKAGDTYLSFIQRLTEVFGYRGFQDPTGRFRVKRAIGPPNAAVSKRTYAEGVDGFAISRSQDSRPIRNWIEVEGVTYRTSEDGADITIRSYPSTVPVNPLVPGVPRAMTVTNDLLDTQLLADAARAVLELEYNSQEPYTIGRADVIAQPDRSPGEVVTVTSATTGLSGAYWLRRLSHDIGPDGAMSSLEVWRPGGTVQPGGTVPAGTDACATTSILAGAVHLGDSTRTDWAMPVPVGTTHSTAFTPTAAWLSLVITGRVHHANFEIVGGAIDSGAVSKVQVWQAGTMVGESALPVHGEGVIKVSDPTTWTSFDLPIGGNLTSGVAAEARFIAGQLGTGYDDFEVAAIGVTTCTQGTLPVPTTPPPTSYPPAKPASSCVNTVTSGTATEVSLGNARPEVGGWVIPAGTTKVIARAIFTGVSSATSAINGGPIHAVRWYTNGGQTDIFVPGTTTRLVGDGAGEHIWTSQPYVAATAITVSDFVFQAYEGSFSFSGLCISFAST